jgi:hypothetical protein
MVLVPDISSSQHTSLLRPIRQTIPFLHGTSNSQKESGAANGSGGVGTGGGGGTGGAGGGAGDSEALATAQQALAIANTALALATSALQPGDVAEEVFDGTIIDLQDKDGVVGTTSGNLIFAQKTEDDEIARPVRATEQGLVVDQSETYTLLMQISESLAALQNKLNRR